MKNKFALLLFFTPIFPVFTGNFLPNLFISKKSK